MNRIVLKVSPIGDAFMTRGVIPALCVALRDSGHAHQVLLCIPEHLNNLFLDERVFCIDETEILGEKDIVIDVCRYLEAACHVTFIPDPWFIEQRKGYGHLVTWIGKYIQDQLAEHGITLKKDFVADPCSVRFDVNALDVVEVQTLLSELLGERSKLPFVLMHANAGSPNRCIPAKVLAETCKCLRDEELTVVLLGPHPNSTYEAISGHHVVHLKVALSLLPALLLTANAVVMPDTGPGHIAAAVRQGIFPVQLAERPHGGEVIWVLGSSLPEAITYAGNKVVYSGYDRCEIAPCGHHGYTNPPVAYGNKSLVTLETGKSACLFESYAQAPHIAPCMEVQAKDIADAVVAVLDGE